MTQKEEKYVLELRKHLPRKMPSFPFTFITSTIFILFFSYIISLDFIKAIFLFLLPYVLITFVDYGMTALTHTYFPLRRISSLNVLVFFFSLLLFIIFRIFFPFFLSFFLAFSSLVYLRHIIYAVFMHDKKPLNLTMGVLYNFIYIIIALLYFREYLYPYLISTFLYWFAAHLTLRFSVSKFVKEFGENPLWFLSSFVNYMSKNKREEVHELNGFFKNIYSQREVPITLLGFHRSDGSLKAMFVFPYIHPGPFGSVGGSDIPNKLEKYTGLNNLLVFHTTTTHDDNIATEEDVKKIANIIKKYSGRGKYDRFSDFKRFHVGNIEVATQIFGNYALIFLIPSKRFFDDVDFRAGMTIRRKLLNFFEDAAVVDAHNNFDENALPLTLSAHEINIIKKKLKELKADEPIKMGFASSRIQGKSIGPGGIRTVVFEYGDRRIAYILLDGNNIKKGLRERIRTEALKIVDEAEIFSTDNHIVNYNFLDLNPIGDKDSWDLLIGKIISTLKKAVENIEEVKVEALTEFVMLNMASRGQLHKLTEITRLSVGRAKIIAPLSLSLSFILSLIVFILFFYF